MIYEVHDTVNGYKELLDNYDELKAYASDWCERLNEEQTHTGETPFHHVRDKSGIEDVLECCNIELHEV